MASQHRLNQIQVNHKLELIEAEEEKFEKIKALQCSRLKKEYLLLLCKKSRNFLRFSSAKRNAERQGN